MSNDSNFNFENLEKRRPLWKDVAYFLGITLIIWGGSHAFLNRDAFGQIAEFKYEQLKASVITNWEEIQEKEEALVKVEPTKPQEVKLEKVAHKKKSIFRKKELTPRNQAKQVFEDMKVYPSDNRLYIPRINKNVPLVSVPNHQNWNQLEKNIQKGLQEGVVVHPISHAPGNFGNLFLTGHSSYYQWDSGRFKDVFALLHEVKVGDNIEVYWEGKKYIYRIKHSEVVKPTQVEVLNQPKDRFLITLMTCTPVGTNKNRLILTGELRRQE